MSETGSQSAGNRQLDWLAGFMDGEGSLMLVKNKGGRKVGFALRPTATIANTHYPTILRAEAIFKENGLGVWICTNRPKRGNYPPQYAIFICGYKRMSRFLELLRERLFTKRQQADLLKEFIDSRAGCKPGDCYTEREAAIADEIKTLNNSRYWMGSSETLRVAVARKPPGHRFRSKVTGRFAPEDKVQPLETI